MARARTFPALLLHLALLPSCSGETFGTAELVPHLDTDAAAAGASSSDAPPAANDAAATSTPKGADAGSLPHYVPEPPPAAAGLQTPCGLARHAALAPDSSDVLINPALNSMPAPADVHRDEACIGSGIFTMGSNEPNIGQERLDHTPSHSVKLAAYFLDAYEVTVARYRSCVDAGGCTTAGTSGNSACTYTPFAAEQEEHPMTCVTWEQASAFCSWDGGRRLPSEAEWEYAARAESGSHYPWGDTFSCDHAITGSAGSCKQYGGPIPRPVGSAPSGATASGVHDLVGNVAEWVHDWASSYPSTAVENPHGPDSGALRLIRSSSWNTPPAFAWTYFRLAALPTASGSWGFRCARDAETAP